MTTLAIAASLLITAAAAALRFGGSSMLHTARADALHDAAEGRRGAARIAQLLERSSLVLQPSIGAVHSALLVIAAIPATWALAILETGWVLAGLLAVLALLLIVGGDVLPRSLGRSRPGRPAYRLAWLLAPAVRIGRVAADFLADDEGDADHDDDDLQDSEEIELIESVLEFGDVIVREVMSPRADIVSVSVSDDTDVALAGIMEHGRSRVPVIGADLDEIVGVLYARDLLGLYATGDGPKPVHELMRPAQFVPETKRVSELLREAQASKVHLYLVVDEFGSTAGVVTMEDLLEEIVGEIVDEYDDEEPMVETLASGDLGVDARLPVDELAEIIGMPLPEGDWDTVGGLVLALAGRVPEEGEVFAVEGCAITVEAVQGRRVSRVRVSTVSAS